MKRKKSIRSSQKTTGNTSNKITLSKIKPNRKAELLKTILKGLTLTIDIIPKIKANSRSSQGEKPLVNITNKLNKEAKLKC